MPLKPEAMEEQGLKFVDGPAASTTDRDGRVFAPMAPMRPMRRQRDMMGIGQRLAVRFVL